MCYHKYVLRKDIFVYKKGCMTMKNETVELDLEMIDLSERCEEYIKKTGSIIYYTDGWGYSVETEGQMYFLATKWENAEKEIERRNSYIIRASNGIDECIEKHFRSFIEMKRWVLCHRITEMNEDGEDRYYYLWNYDFSTLKWMEIY